MIADLVQAESGKARRDAFEEIGDVALAARYAAARGPRLLRDHRRLGLIPGLTIAIEVRHPVGIVGVISPWNYPLTLAISDSLPAFVAGNAVVHKPDTQGVLTALLARSIAEEAGLPEALWQIVVGDGPTIGAAVVEQADYVSFTGSTATGRIVARRLGERLVGASLELGGKNALLVLDDADLDRAAEGAVRACFSCAGQLCVSTERVYVAAPVRAEFQQRFVDRVRDIRLGAAYDYSCDVGSLVSQEQLDKVIRHVGDAVTNGANVVTGGSRRPDLGPWFFEPTVLEGVRPGMLVADEETFGPVVAMYSVRRRRRGSRRCQRDAVRPERQRLDVEPRPWHRRRQAASIRHGQHQRGLRSSLGEPRPSPRRDEGLGHGPAARPGRHPPVHRAAGNCRPADARLQPDRRHELRLVRRRVHARASGHAPHRPTVKRSPTTQQPAQRETIAAVPCQESHSAA